MPFFPNFLLRDLLLWLIVLNVLAILAVFFPWEFGKKADAFAPAPAGIRPEWYFLFMFQTLKYFPARILFIDGEVLGICCSALPEFSGCSCRSWTGAVPAENEGKVVTYIGMGVIAYIVVLTILGWLP